jgi:hypothetical protein
MSICVEIFMMYLFTRGLCHAGMSVTLLSSLSLIPYSHHLILSLNISISNPSYPLKPEVIISIVLVARSRNIQ